MEVTSNQEEKVITNIPAGFGSRFVAALIDAMIGFSISFVAGLILGIFWAMLFGSQTPVIISYLLGFAITFIYYGYSYSTYAASPGKMAMGLKVTKNQGRKLTYIEAFLRESVGKFVSAVIFFIGYIMVLFRDDKKALHDLILDTKVFKSPIQ